MSAELLRERGLGWFFAATWIEGDDPAEIARLLRADPEDGVPCELAEAMRHFDPYALTELIWLGAHAPGWSHAVTIAGPPLRTAPLLAAGRKYVHVVWDGPGPGVHDLVHSDGVTEFRQPPARVHDPGWRLHEYAEGLLPPGHPGVFDVLAGGGERQCLDNWLTVAARLTGRALTEEALSAPRLLYRLPI
ncbi:hypothetical protein [Nonomuraea sp. NPDC050310]|uniref:hypothetical protein n=1 Tax=Nonomuraea sp. NPDC050310 TaxID=3154935 RepID=UPI0033E67FD2